jgi:two-component sensor histidine kinase
MPLTPVNASKNGQDGDGSRRLTGGKSHRGRYVAGYIQTKRAVITTALTSVDDRSIKVQASSGGAVSSEAVSLGLIVTELVINALKHGFQGGEEGEILVKYDAQGSDWQLSVTDNGSGPKEAAGVPPHTGLGTSIVEALAHQLNATVEKSSGAEGTCVTITAAEHR